MSSERGAALLAALCFATVLAIALASYMTVCYRTLAMSTQSGMSTRSVELAESGMEDGLWALNKNDWSTWTISGTTATKTVTGFTYGGGLTGTVTETVTNYTGASGTRTLTVAGSITQANGNTITRTLTATAAPAPLFVNAINATTGRVKFKSAGTVDSYDSSLGDYSVANSGYSAIVASESTSVTSATVQIANAQIKGYVATVSTGPSYSTSAKLIGPTTPGTTKIDTTRESTSPYQPLFDENVPTGAMTLLPTGTATIGTPGSSTQYTTTDLILNTNQVLTVNGPVVLTITGNLYISDTAQIVVTATGSLEIHLAGDLAIDGNGIQNNTKLAKNVSIIAKADSIYDSFEIGTTNAFYGVLYAPNNTVTMNSNMTVYGALVVKSLTVTYSPTFHYDINLRNATFAGLSTPFAVANWHDSTD